MKWQDRVLLGLFSFSEADSLVSLPEVFASSTLAGYVVAPASFCTHYRWISSSPENLDDLNHSREYSAEEFKKVAITLYKPCFFEWVPLATWGKIMQCGMVKLSTFTKCGYCLRKSY